MGAYIINIPDTVDRIIYVNVGPDSGRTYISSHRVEDLTPYTEPDLEQIRKEAYKDGYDAGFGRKIDASYQEGLSDAWEAARKIGSNSMCSLEEMGFDFSQCAVPDYNPSWFVVKNYSASECIEKIRQYEQRQEEQDGLRQNIQTIVDKCGYSLDEIATVLEKMREESNG